MDILVIVPAYNEGQNIETVINDVKKEAPQAEIMVINDGSSDQTGFIAEATQKATVINLPYNLGIGGAVQAGFKYAKRNGFQTVVRVDGDGQHPAQGIAMVLEPILNGEADMVIGSRFLYSSGEKPRSVLARRIGQKIIGFVLTIISGQKITDASSGFRAYNEEVINLLNKYYPADYPEPEEIIFLKKNNFRIKEVGVPMKIRTKGSSSITSVRSIYYALKVALSLFIGILRNPIIKK